MRGPKRRAGIEVRMRAAAGLDNEASGVPKWNKAHNQTHTLITRGHIKLTSSRADSRYTVIRSSFFRKQYAEAAQILLFPEDERPEPAPGPYLFVMIIHGPAQKDHYKASFCRRCFPR